MSKYMCEHCCAVFDEQEIVGRVTDRHPYGESYAPEWGSSCPECGSTEITEAFKCVHCGGWFPVDRRHWHPIEDAPLCEDCAETVEHDIESSPYHGCEDVYSILDMMIGA